MKTLNIVDIVSFLKTKKEIELSKESQKRAMLNGPDLLKALEEIVFQFQPDSSRDQAAYDNALHIIARVKQDLVTDIEYDKIFKAKKA